MPRLAVAVALIMQNHFPYIVRGGVVHQNQHQNMYQSAQNRPRGLEVLQGGCDARPPLVD